MKNFTLLFLALAGLMFIASCSDTETYADRKKKERTAISKFLTDSSVTVISEAEFLKDTTTDVSKNEYVLFASSGVYMQIVRRGCGDIIKDGERTGVLCRFSEFNLMTDSLELTNNFGGAANWVDKMVVWNTSGTYTGTFDANSSLMATVYQSTSVPTGWMSAFPYIKIGRPSNANEDIAKVKLIVPSDKGTLSASNAVTPYLYTLTFERGR